MVTDNLQPPGNVNGVYKQALNSVSISWSAVSDAEKYNVYRRATDESEFTILESTSGLEIIDNRIVSETDYEYYVVAIKGDSMESAPSSTVFVSIPLTDSEVDPNLLPEESPTTNPIQPSNETVSPSPTPTN
jgi:fibronectin type 3 domain-containing protein